MAGPVVRLIASPQSVACDHSRASGRALLSAHNTSEGTVSYLRCACGVRLVLQEGELLSVVASSPLHALPHARGTAENCGHA